MRSVYCKARFRDGERPPSGAPEALGPYCETVELAQQTSLESLPAENIVILRIDQRLGLDGAWHAVNETIVRWEKDGCPAL